VRVREVIKNATAMLVLPALAIQAAQCVPMTWPRLA